MGNQQRGDWDRDVFCDPEISGSGKLKAWDRLEALCLSAVCHKAVYVKKQCRKEDENE